MIKDHYGHPCIIPAGAAARPLINKLHALGYEYIVLPRHTLLTGEAVDATMKNVVDNTRLQDCLYEARQIEASRSST